MTTTSRYPAASTALMTATGLEQLRGELEVLRHRAQQDVTQRLHDARSYGNGSNNDEYHAVLEDQMVLWARIAMLEETVGRAVVVDPGEAGEGVAVIGATVLVEDLTSGSERRYRLASAHAMDSGAISAASPMGHALMGATAGQVVTLDLPDGSSRSVRLLAVEAAATHGQPGAAVKVPTTAP